jgi:hypothetical protein
MPGNQKKGDVTLDDLANIMGLGFKELRTEMNEQFVEVRADIKEVDRKVDLVRSDCGRSGRYRSSH